MTTKEAIKQEAEECAQSAKDQRNTPEDREIFHVLSIVLGGIAEKLDSPNAEVRDGGPVASDSARDAIPPFSAPTGSGDFLKP